MTCEFHDELLSAYLDGELSADERAALEQRLADSPELRGMLDELQSVSHQVRSLPPQSAGGDFAPRVVQAALAAAAVAPAASR
jgi:anti-sigma factor RsiW